MSRFVLTAQLQLQAPNNVAQVVRQIQNQLQGVSVNVQVRNAAQAQRQVQQLANTCNGAADASTRLGRTLVASVRRFTGLAIATRAVSLLTNTLGNAVETAIDFERELVKVSQVTGRSISSLKDLTGEITRLSTTLGSSSSSLINVSRILSQAGLNADETRIALNALAKSDLAPTFDDITQTAEGAVAIFNQFRQGAEALEQQLGAINAVAGKFAVEAGDLISVIRRTGGVFKAAGGDINELIALFTSVRATTRESAESIATGLRTIFTRIQRPKTIEYLRKFGVELLDLEGKFVGPFEAVRRLSGALAGLEQGDITFVQIAEELGGFRQIGKVIPLIQQFKVSQEALNVAIKGGDSLSKDAASAQAALAVRIAKVREEFLALVRGISESTAFQLFANTALNLASALIKVGEALKPVLPLITAFAAVNIARVGAGLAGGLLGRTFNTGGRVHRFARGGVVPGSGNRDTVPAMLTPGEFVIRKSSVNKLGANNLAAMNENRYNQGTNKRGIVGATQRLRSTQKRKGPFDPKEAKPGSAQLQFRVNEGQIGAFVLTPPKGSEGSYKPSKDIPFVLPPSNKYAQLAAKQAGLDPQTDISGGVNAVLKKASYPVFYPGLTEGRSNLSKNAQYSQAVTNGVNSAIQSGIQSTINSVTASKLLDIPPAFNTNEKLIGNVISSMQNDSQITSSMGGYLFEGMISALTGAQAAGGKASFDFPRSAISQNKAKLAALFGSEEMINKLIKAEAKRSYGEVSGVTNKLINDIKLNKKGGVSVVTSGKRERKGFATGGSVGTDTVPALLTPGEFVINRKSAQNIGYGNLNRMNKVGKYAKGGVVQRFQTGGQATTGSSTASTVAILSILPALTSSFTEADSAINKITNTFSGLFLQFTLLSEGLSRIRNSSLDIGSTFNNMRTRLNDIGRTTLPTFSRAFDAAAQKLKQSSFGVGVKAGSTGTSLNVARATMGGPLTNTQMLTSTPAQRLAAARAANAGGGVASRVSSGAGVVVGKISGGLSSVLDKLTANFNKLSSAALTAFIGFQTIQALGGLFKDLTGNTVALNDAIKKGQVAAAEAAAGTSAIIDTITNSLSAAFAGGSIGMAIGGPLGAAVGAAIGAGLGYILSAPTESAKTLAAAQAQAVVAQKALIESQQETEKALKQFNEGAISSAQLLQIASSAAAAALEANRREDAALTSSQASSSTIFGQLRQSLGFEQSTSSLAAQQEEDRKKREAAIIQNAQPGINAFARSAAASGKSFEEFMASLKTENKALYDILIKSGTDDLENAFGNIQKSVERARIQFERLNLGLSNVSAVAKGSLLALENIQSLGSLETSGLERSLATLEAGLTNAATSISEADFDAAVTQGANALISLGASQDQITKFTESTRTINALQRETPAILKTFKSNLTAKEFAELPAQEIQKRFADELQSQLEGFVPENVLADLTELIRSGELTPEQQQALQLGDISVLQSFIDDFAKVNLGEFSSSIQDAIKIDKELAALTKQRISLENQLVSAQQRFLSAQLEAAEIIAEFGGPAVTPDIRRQNIISQANVQGATIPGISALRTGSAAEISQRTREINAERNRIDAIRQSRAAGNEDALSAQQGTELQAREDRLNKLAEDQYNVTKQLIDVRKRELEIIKARNSEEKKGLEALLQGDFEQFFDRQAAAGATAAIATGNQALISAYGPGATAGAFENLRNMQQQGVQTIFGQQIGGAGGLLEQGAAAALTPFGLQGQAQMLAGTTPEEQAIQAEIRALAETLPETAQVQADAANKLLEAANKQIEAANTQLQAIRDRVQNRASGGLIYANRGMFVPRGTDTVPAMLTPGEFVVRKSAVQRGNNLQLLKAINSGNVVSSNSGSTQTLSRGGSVQYLQNGGEAVGGLGISTDVMNNFSTALNNFNNQLAQNIQNLQNTKFQITLNPTNINVNLTGTSFLEQLTSTLKQDLLKYIGQEIQQYSVGTNGKITKEDMRV